MSTKLKILSFCWVLLYCIIFLIAIQYWLSWLIAIFLLTIIVLAYYFIFLHSINVKEKYILLEKTFKYIYYWIWSILGLFLLFLVSLQALDYYEEWEIKQENERKRIEAIEEAKIYLYTDCKLAEEQVERMYRKVIEHYWSAELPNTIPRDIVVYSQLIKQWERRNTKECYVYFDE